MKKERVRAHGATVWLNDAELAEVQKLTGGVGHEKPSSEWLRDFLLTSAKQRPNDIALMGETLALRALVVNLLDHLVTRKPVTETTVRELLKHADAEKHVKAGRAFAAVEAA